MIHVSNVSLLLGKVQILEVEGRQEARHMAVVQDKVKEMDPREVIRRSSLNQGTARHRVIVLDLGLLLNMGDLRDKTGMEVPVTVEVTDLQVLLLPPLTIISDLCQGV